jgi:hypothetical protein
MKEDFTPIRLICLMILPIFRGGMKVQKIAVPRKTPVFPSFSTFVMTKFPNF